MPELSVKRSRTAKEVLRCLLPMRGLLGISRLTETNSYLGVGVSIVSAIRTQIDFAQVSSTQGKGFNINQAAAGALAEALERHCAYHIEPHRISTTGDGMNPSGRAPDPLFGQGDAYTCNWIAATDIQNGQETWLPAQEVAFPYRRTENEPEHIRAYTSGLAAGGTVAEATLFGLIEAYERHVTSMFYVNVCKHGNGQLVNQESIGDETAGRLVNALHEIGCKLIIMRLTALLPVYYVAALDTCNLSPKFMIAGTGAALCEIDALRAALLECVQGVVTGLQGAREDLDRLQHKYAQQDYAQTNVFYRVNELLTARNETVSFIQEPIEVINAEEALPWLLKKFKGAVNGAIHVCDLSQEAFPLSVVKVVSPALNDALSNPRRHMPC